MLETKSSWIKCLPLALLNVWTQPRTDVGISPFEMLYGMRYDLELPLDHPHLQDDQLKPYLIQLMNRRRELQKKRLVAQRPPLDMAIHKVQPGDKVLVRTWKEVSLTPQWEGPYVVLSYCNYPSHYYCAYWGCETIASGWNPGAGRDKYLPVQFGPRGCGHRNRVEIVYHRGAGSRQKGNCTFLWVNVTNPTDQGWILRKKWGVRYYESGVDRGGLILIKKERPPETPRIIESNQGLGDRGQPHTVPNPAQPNESMSINVIEETPSPTQFLNVTEGNIVATVSGMWKVINASFQVLNQTNPGITRGCWLCVSARPPYYEVGQAGLAIHEPMLAGPDLQVVLHMLCDADLFHNLSWHQGQADRPVVPQVLVITLLIDRHHISKYPVIWDLSG
uniref:Murine leukemia virus integrase C-terminal domain-containing protein n=1 Tax=Anas zonorhyncha TaxID=75864 RepID=A0A8B9UJ11_9AVES